MFVDIQYKIIGIPCVKFRLKEEYNSKITNILYFYYYKCAVQTCKSLFPVKLSIVGESLTIPVLAPLPTDGH